MSYSLGQATPPSPPPLTSTPSPATVNWDNVKTVGLIAVGVLTVAYLLRGTQFGSWVEEKSRGLEERRLRRRQR